MVTEASGEEPVKNSRYNSRIIIHDKHCRLTRKQYSPFFGVYLSSSGSYKSGTESDVIHFHKRSPYLSLGNAFNPRAPRG